MRYRQIEAFRHVMVTGTTTGAANAMAVTQPAVSRLIADLEEDLQFRLFDRHRGRLLPTPEALRFFQGIEQFYMGLDRLERIAEQIRTQQPEDLRVCATPALSTSVFPAIVPKFRADHPAVNLMIEGHSISEVVGRLQAHSAHLALTLAFPEVAGIVQEPLIDAAHVCAVHESHPLASKEVVTPEDFIGEQVLSILPTGMVNWNSVGEILRRGGVETSAGIAFQNAHTGYSLVAANLAVALIEPFAASSWAANGVVVRPFRPRVTFTYVMAYSLSLPQTEPFIDFVTALRSLFHEPPWTSIIVDRKAPLDEPVNHQSA